MGKGSLPSYYGLGERKIIAKGAPTAGCWGKNTHTNERRDCNYSHAKQKQVKKTFGCGPCHSCR